MREIASSNSFGPSNFAHLAGRSVKASEFDEPVKDIQGLHIVAPLLYVISCHSPHTIGFMITSHLKRTWFEASVRREPVVPDAALQPKAKTTLETKQNKTIETKNATMSC